jgi:hypothetical protein
MRDENMLSCKNMIIQSEREGERDENMKDFFS